MPHDAPRPRGSTPWHLPACGTFFLALGVAGAYDQFMLFSGNADYFARQGFGAEHVAYFTYYPLSLTVIWTAAIWSVVGAAVLLLLRSRLSVPVAMLAVALQLILNLATFVLMDRWRVFGAAMAAFDLSITVAIVCQFIYARAMARRGVLG